MYILLSFKYYVTCIRVTKVLLILLTFGFWHSHRMLIDFATSSDHKSDNVSRDLFNPGKEQENMSLNHDNRHLAVNCGNTP